MIMQEKNGFVMLISVVIALAVGGAIATALLLMGLGASRRSFSVSQSIFARELAATCSELALEQIRESTSFTGFGSTSTAAGSCSYSVTNTGGVTRQINSSSTVGRIIRKEKVTVDALTPLIHIASWQEVADF